MPADDLPIEPDRLPDAPHEKTPIAARERRETERLITDWERESRQLGHALALMTLDVSAMTGPKWAHRFIIAVDPVVEDSSFLFYGARFASLLGLPETPNLFPSAPARQRPTQAPGWQFLTRWRYRHAILTTAGFNLVARCSRARRSLSPSLRRASLRSGLRCRLPQSSHRTR